MSFNNAFTNDLELDAADHAQYLDFPDFERLSKSIDSNLHIFKSTHSATIRRYLQQHDALDKDAPDYQQRANQLVQSLKEAIGKCVTLFKEVNQSTSDLNNYLRQCELEHADEDTISYLRQKESILISTTKNALHLFQRQQRKCMSLEKTLMSNLAALIDEAVTVRNTQSQQPQLQPQQQQQQQQQQQPQVQITYEPINAEELEQQLMLIQEREREILQISQDTQEINEIYLNLQGIILEQQFQIDTIEDNILSYHGDVQGAASELRRAERYQRRSGGRMLCCLFILLGVFGSVVLIMVVF